MDQVTGSLNLLYKIAGSSDPPAARIFFSKDLQLRDQKGLCFLKRSEGIGVHHLGPHVTVIAASIAAA